MATIEAVNDYTGCVVPLSFLLQNFILKKNSIFRLKESIKRIIINFNLHNNRMKTIIIYKTFQEKGSLNILKTNLGESSVFKT